MTATTSSTAQPVLAEAWQYVETLFFNNITSLQIGPVGKSVRHRRHR